MTEELLGSYYRDDRQLTSAQPTLGGDDLSDDYYDAFTQSLNAFVASRRGSSARTVEVIGSSELNDSDDEVPEYVPPPEKDFPLPDVKLDRDEPDHAKTDNDSPEDATSDIEEDADIDEGVPIALENIREASPLAVVREAAPHAGEDDPTFKITSAFVVEPPAAEEPPAVVEPPAAEEPPIASLLDGLAP